MPLRLPRRPFHVLAACVALALPALRAAADVDAEIRSGDLVKGTLDPGTETETFRIAVLDGAKLTVKAKALKKGPPVRVVVRDTENVIVATGTERGGTSTVSSAPVGSSGTWSAVVTSRDGAATGDYSFSAKWALPRSRTDTLTFVESSREQVIFAAERGTRVKVVVTPARGSGVVPRIESLLGPNGRVDGVGTSGPKTSSAGPVVLPDTGTYALRVDDDGTGGDAVVKISFTPPKTKPRKIDITARKTGTSGDDGAYARVVDAGGGVVEVPSGIGGLEAIEGSSVAIPSGALPAGSAIFVGTAPDLRLGGGDFQQVGAPVSFGPEGTVFGTKTDPKQATLTIPVDLAAVGGDTSKVRVFTRDAKGRETLVDPPYDFSRPGYVSFPTSHFSSYVAASEETAGPGGPTAITLAGGLTQAYDIAYALNASSVTRVLYVADGTDVLKDVSSNGSGGFVVGNYAGGGALTADGTNRLSFDFGGEIRAVHATADAVYVGTSAFTVYRIDDATDQVTRILGDGISGDSGDDGPSTSARIRSCADLFEDVDGNLWVIDSLAARARRIDVGGIITTFAGTGQNGSNGDGNPASATRLDVPVAITDRPATTDLFLAERGRVRILHVDTDTVETLAGDPSGGTGCAAGGETGTAARFDQLSGIAFDILSQRVLVSSEGCDAIYGIHHTTKKVDVAAGTPGVPGFTPDGGGGTFRLTNPRGLLGAANVLFLIDFGGGAADVRVREVILPVE